MNLGYPLGAASQALPSLRPGERLLWAAYGRTLNYDVRGLDPWGAPKKSALGKLGSGAANFAGGVVDAMVGSNGGDGSNPLPPQVIVRGEQGGLAHAAVRELPTSGSPSRLWVLTGERLLVLKQYLPPEPEKAGKSFMSKAIGFGKGVVKTGKEITEIFTKMTYGGQNPEGVPIATHEMVPCAEISREKIAGFAVTERGKKVPCLRMSLVDGSGMDFLFGCDDPAQFAWLHSLTVS